MPTGQLLTSTTTVTWPARSVNVAVPLIRFPVVAAIIATAEAPPASSAVASATDESAGLVSAPASGPAPPLPAVVPAAPPVVPPAPPVPLLPPVAPPAPL